jgi:hypothetical protein
MMSEFARAAESPHVWLWTSIQELVAHEMARFRVEIANEQRMPLRILDSKLILLCISSSRLWAQLQR